MKEQILFHLPGDHPWQNQIHWFDSIDSTNLEAKRMAQSGAPHGTVLIAGHQTAGRGRLGRSFLSPAGMGIYMSVLLHPHCKPEKLMHLTCAAAVSACDAIEAAAGFRPDIKWTNDLVYQSKKVAGILTELSIDPKNGLVEYAIIGIGVNCCQRTADFDPSIQDFAGSVSMFAENSLDRARLSASMIQAFLKMDMDLLADHTGIMKNYRKQCISLGKDVSILRADGSVQHGHAVDIDDAGALLVRFADGNVTAVNSGEVSVRGMYGYV